MKSLQNLTIASAVALLAFAGSANAADGGFVAWNARIFGIPIFHEL